MITPTESVLQFVLDTIMYDDYFDIQVKCFSTNNTRSLHPLCTRWGAVDKAE